MDNLIVKNVDVMGDFITAAKDNDGNVWVGVRWVCDALDMTEGQMKRQIKNIKKDVVFGEGGSNQIPLPTGQGTQEVFCIRNDFIPLWLAKISITQKTRDERPEFSKKLLEYQLKAKDILAEAFMPKQDDFPRTTQAHIRLLAQGNVELNQRVDEVNTEVQSVKKELKEFKETLPLLPEDADEISDLVKKRGVEILGGKQSPAYQDRSLTMKLYANFYSNLKYNFNVRTYKAIKRNQKDKAIEVIQRYEPPFFLAQQIESVNAQQTLDLEGGVR